MYILFPNFELVIPVSSHHENKRSIRIVFQSSMVRSKERGRRREKERETEKEREKQGGSGRGRRGGGRGRRKNMMTQKSLV